MTIKFTRISLITNSDNISEWYEDEIPLLEGSESVKLTSLMPSDGYQIRKSPVGFGSSFHCSSYPQYVFILQGIMEITLQDGTSRKFIPGQHFLSTDLCPDNIIFDETKHGHKSANISDEILITLFLRIIQK